MIRRLFVCVSLFVCVGVSAAPAGPVAPVSFSFGAVPLVQFAQATYRDLLGRDFVLSNELLGLGKKVTVSVKQLDPAKLPAFVDQVLAQQGVRATLRQGVYFLDVASGPVDQVLPVEPAAGRVQQLPQRVDQVEQNLAGNQVDQHAAGEQVAAHPIDQVKDLQVVQVMNRPVEFMVAAVNGAIGAQVARPAGGSRMVVSVPKERKDQVLSLVAQLDVAAQVVEVSASFIEVTRSQSDASGLSLVAGTISRKLGVSVVPAEGRVSIGAGRYDLVLDALAGDGRFNQVSNSRVVGDDAEKLSLSVGDETPTIASTGKDNLGNAVQNVVYRPSGVILDVLPHVLGSGRLALSVDGQVSAFQSTTNGVAGSPTLVKRQVRTAVSVADGEVLVIGGLNDSKVTRANAGLSFLPRSWSTRSGSETKTDLVLILSARVLAGRVDADLQRAL